MKHICIFALLFLSTFILKAQSQFLDFGLGAKYDVFKIKQSESVFERNFDLGATAFISYSRPFINKNVLWEAGLATNNYKVNFKVNGENGLIFSNRELVSVMRSNRLFLNVVHLTKRLNSKLTWANTCGVSLLIGNKNPYDVVLQRSKEVETTVGSQSIDIKIKTYGLTGSAILIGGGTKLYYQFNKDIKLAANLAFITGMGELTKVDLDYVIGSSVNYKKAIFTSNGFAPMFTLGVNYGWGSE